jgi:hypothetical protein
MDITIKKKQNLYGSCFFFLFAIRLKGACRACRYMHLTAKWNPAGRFIPRFEKIQGRGYSFRDIHILPETSGKLGFRCEKRAVNLPASGRILTA